MGRPVPGAWEEKGSSRGPHARRGGLLSEVADAHEAYVNGVRVGAGGKLPPAFESVRHDRHAHKVPVGTLKKDQWNEIAIRVYNQAGSGGFLGEAPSIMTYNLECLMEGPWEFFSGGGYTPGGALEAEPKVGAFSTFRSSSRVLARAKELVTGPKLGPQESLAKVTTAPDLRRFITVSSVSNKMHFCGRQF